MGKEREVLAHLCSSNSVGACCITFCMYMYINCRIHGMVRVWGSSKSGFLYRSDLLLV